MGGDIVPAFVEQGEAYVYDFKNNDVPGATERDRGYWRDVGTIDSYFDAHMDLVSIHPVFNLYNYDWPIYTELRALPAGQVRPRPRRPGRRGAQLGGLPRRRHLRRPGQRLGALAPACKVHSYAEHRRQRDPRRRARSAGTAAIRRAIIDKNVVDPRARQIGIDHEHDGRAASRSPSRGITVVGKGQVVNAVTDGRR